VAERRAARADSAAEIRQRKLRATVQLVGTALGALGDAPAGSGRGQGHRGAAPSSSGQALIRLSVVLGLRRGNARRSSSPSPYLPREENLLDDGDVDEDDDDGDNVARTSLASR